MRLRGGGTMGLLGGYLKNSQSDCKEMMLKYVGKEYGCGKKC